MNIEIQVGDVFGQTVDAVVHPTNGLCVFVTTLSRELRTRAGETVERELQTVAPLAVGAAFVTGGGKLAAPFIIHVPVLDEPGQQVHAENVRRATRAALLAALRKGFASLAMPGLLTEKGGVTADAMARAMLDELRGHKAPRPEVVYLVDQDPVVVENFRLTLGNR